MKSSKFKDFKIAAVSFIISLIILFLILSLLFLYLKLYENGMGIHFDVYTAEGQSGCEKFPAYSVFKYLM